MTPSGSSSSPTPGGPVASPVACAGCGKPVDPLRAGHVAIFDDQFEFFCARECREPFLARKLDRARGASQAPRLDPSGARASADARGPHAAAASAQMPDPLHRAHPPPDLADPFNETALAQATPHPPAGRSDTGTLLLLSATIVGVLAIALALVGSPALLARLVLSCVGVALLLTRAWIRPSEPSDPHSAAIHGPCVLAAAIAVWARATGNPVTEDATVLAGLTVVSTGTAAHLVEQIRRDGLGALRDLQQAFDCPARRVVADGYRVVPPSALRPGEQVLVDAGETVPTDVVITAGEATALPWFGAQTANLKRSGDALVAGARLVSGRIHATVTWTGLDRTWLRTTVDPSRATHVAAPMVRLARSIVERWALASAALAALASLANNMPPARVLLSAVAAHAAIASVATAAVASAHVLRAVLSALHRGIAFQSAEAWTDAGLASVALFAARGTLLLGEPQVADIVALGSVSTEHVLALAAGSQAAASDPASAAIMRVCRTRGIQPDAVRSPTLVPGLGVVATASSGEPLCVGSRALMLREHVSMALVEQRLAELEALGRTVLLVAVSTKLVGYLALQDGLRPGARAAVQHLLDAGIEPVFMSSDARETSEAIARSIEIEHVRPEVLPAERAHEVRRISDSGATVAVVGRPAADGDVLEAADVSVALGGAGSSAGAWAVCLASDDVREASVALVSARRARNHARNALWLCLVPGIAGALSISFGLLPPSYAPLAVLIGGIAAQLHYKMTE